MKWLSQPNGYWTPTPDLRDDVRDTTQLRGNPTRALFVEGYLQAQIKGSLSSVDSWLDPTYYNPRNTDKTLDGFVAAFVWTAQKRIEFYPTMGQDVDPVSLGVEYGSLFVSVLQQINSGGMKNGVEGRSVWDVWVSQG